MPFLRSDFHRLVIHQLISAHSLISPNSPGFPPDECILALNDNLATDEQVAGAQPEDVDAGAEP